MFEAAVRVAKDRSATTPARIFAIRTLLWALRPGVRIGYARLLAARGTGYSECTAGLGPSLELEVTVGTPLPIDWIAQVRAAGRALVAESGQPRDVSEAAGCLISTPVWTSWAERQ